MVVSTGSGDLTLLILAAAKSSKRLSGCCWIIGFCRLGPLVKGLYLLLFTVDLTKKCDMPLSSNGFVEKLLAPMDWARCTKRLLQAPKSGDSNAVMRQVCDTIHLLFRFVVQLSLHCTKAVEYLNAVSPKPGASMSFPNTSQPKLSAIARAVALTLATAAIGTAVAQTATDKR